MAQTTLAERPALASPRAQQTLEAVRVLGTDHFDLDVFHVIDERDNQLIADEILSGAGSRAFVYDFEITQGTRVAGISVIGARHLAAHYKGLKHRLVAAMQKSGPLFTFTSYPAENLPMAVSCNMVHELGDEPDFYCAVVEVTDIKTGNSIQIERREARFERRRDGSQFERPNYATIAQSKAYRNAILALIPQDVQIRWKEEMLKLDRKATITESVIDTKRGNVLRFAAQKAIAIDRQSLDRLTLDQIAGLGDAAREGNLPAFAQAAQALGLVGGAQQEQQETTPAASVSAEAAPRRRGRPPREPQQGPPAPEANPQTPPADAQTPTQDPRPSGRVAFEV